MQAPPVATSDAERLAKPVNIRVALIFLFLGNIVIGSGVLAPAAMINAMTADLRVTPVAIGALIGWGAVILCIGAPAFGFFTNRIDRRTLLAASLLLYAAGHAASVFAADYATLMVIRLAMISGAAIFTPQAAGAVTLMVPEARRAGAVAFVFMGWAVATAVVIPFMSILGEALNWRSIYAGIAIAAILSAIGDLACAVQSCHCCCQAPSSADSRRVRSLRPLEVRSCLQQHCTLWTTHTHTPV
jgi:predicted MFS family arabinose efflux permease